MTQIDPNIRQYDDSVLLKTRFLDSASLINSVNKMIHIWRSEQLGEPFIIIRVVEYDKSWSTYSDEKKKFKGKQMPLKDFIRIKNQEYYEKNQINANDEKCVEVINKIPLTESELKQVIKGKPSGGIVVNKHAKTQSYRKKIIDNITIPEAAKILNIEYKEPKIVGVIGGFAGTNEYNNIINELRGEIRKLTEELKVQQIQKEAKEAFKSCFKETKKFFSELNNKAIELKIDMTMMNEREKKAENDLSNLRKFNELAESGALKMTNEQIDKVREDFLKKVIDARTQREKVKLQRMEQRELIIQANIEKEKRRIETEGVTIIKPVVNKPSPTVLTDQMRESIYETHLLDDEELFDDYDFDSESDI